jgi:hypothetical protein
VVVSSVYVPLALAVHVPVTLSEPEIVGFVQLRGSRPAADASTVPLSLRHGDVTVHVPTTSPPQAVTLVEQDDTPPPPPLPVLELPPVPDPLPNEELQPPEIPAAMVIATTTERRLMGSSPSKKTR